jgi:hypothetical protein
MRSRRFLATVATATTLLAGPAVTTARADDQQVVTSATAEVSSDGAFRFDDAFRVLEFDDEVVNPGNYAYAHAVGCEGCKAVAISFQIVLVQQAPETLAPENLGLALNENCDTCDAAAGAYQFVVGGHPVRLTERGRGQLNAIAHRVDALQWQRLTGPEMIAEADALADQVDSVLQTELRSVRGDDGEHGRVEERRVRDKGHDDRSQDNRSFEVDD